jgi:hypothetical protein
LTGVDFDREFSKTMVQGNGSAISLGSSNAAATVD